MTTWQCGCNDNLAMLPQLGIATAMTTWQCYTAMTTWQCYTAMTTWQCYTAMTTQGPRSRGAPGAQAPPIIFPRLIEWRLIIISVAFPN